MYSNMFRVVIIVVTVFLQSTLAYYNVQPPYQVSIMVEFQAGNLIHHCNGAIVYEKLIITTANCMYFKFGSKGKPKKLDSSDLSVVAGSTTPFSDALRVNVSSIKIVDDFDLETMKNDLALLVLSQSLPLGTRNDMKWIMLDDNVQVNRSCLVNFFSGNPRNAANYYQTEELVLFDNKVCRNFTTHPNARKDDLCSKYVLPQQFDCATADSFLSYNSDRGTGLVCKNYLVGILSSVVTRPDPSNNCSDVELAAMYTNIFPNLMWVYTTMANIDTQYISTPYDAALNSLVINSTYNDTSNKEVLTTTLLPLTTADDTSSWNTTIVNNSTTNYPNIVNSTTTNSTTWNSTITNTTVTTETDTNTNVTASPTVANLTTTTSHPVTVNSTTTWNPISINSTKWNSTAINSTSITNSTRTNRNPQTNYTITDAPPTQRPAYSYTSSTDSYHMPHPTPTIPNFFKNSTASLRFNAVSLLIALVSLRLIIYH